jgi:hypothetical protein
MHASSSSLRRERRKWRALPSYSKSSKSVGGDRRKDIFLPVDIDSCIARRFSIFCDEAGQCDIRRDDAVIEMLPLLVRAGIKERVSDDKIHEAVDRACGEDATRVSLDGFTLAFHMLEKELGPPPEPLPAEWPARFNAAAAPGARISSRAAAKVIVKLFKEIREGGEGLSFTTCRTTLEEQDVRVVLEDHEAADGSIGLDGFVLASRQVFFGELGAH